MKQAERYKYLWGWFSAKAVGKNSCKRKGEGIKRLKFEKYYSRLVGA